MIPIENVTQETQNMKKKPHKNPIINQHLKKLTVGVIKIMNIFVTKLKSHFYLKKF